MYYLPKPRNLGIRLSAQYTLHGRNVGQATTLTTGLLYTIFLNKKTKA